MSDKEHEVNFQNNKVDTKAVKGGYGHWQLMPNGPLEPIGTTSEPITTKATKLQLKGNGPIDVLSPNKNVSYDANELVTMTGPDGDGTVHTKGQSATNDVEWTKDDEKES